MSLPAWERRREGDAKQTLVKGDEKKTCDVLEIKEGKMLYSLKYESKRNLEQE